MEEDEQEHELLISVKQPCSTCQGVGRVQTHIAGDIHCAPREGTGVRASWVLLSVHLGSLDETIVGMTDQITALQERLDAEQGWSLTVEDRLKRTEQRLRAIEDQQNQAHGY